MPTRVVIAEDEAIIRLDLKETLEEEGYEVVGETGGATRPSSWSRTLEPDLAILDIKMPGMDGLEAARAITAERGAAVLILTAFSQRDLIEQARDAGALAYLVKPFQKSELIPAVEVALGRFAEMKALADENIVARRAARHPQAGRPGQGHPDGHARHRRGRRVPLRPEDGDGQRRGSATSPSRSSTGIDSDRRVASPTGGRCGTSHCANRWVEPHRRRMATVMLIDGNSLTYRAFFALPTDMATRQRPGHQRRLRVHLDAAQPGPRPPARPPRRRLRPARADVPPRGRRAPTRPTATAAPDILRQQMGLVRQVLETLAIPSLDMAGFEADDIIATLATQARDAGDDVLIVTGDRDSYQLVEDPHVRVLYNQRGVSDYANYDEAGIDERTGVAPTLYPQYAALRGDPSDNLPGVPGVGEKTAAKLINNYGGLDGIFDHVDEQTPKLRPEPGRARGAGAPERRGDGAAPRRRRSTSSPTTSASASFDREEVRKLFDFLEFRSLHDRLAEAFRGDGVAAHRPAAPTCSRPRSTSLADAGRRPSRCSTAWPRPASRRRSPARGRAQEGRSPLEGLAVVTGPTLGEVVRGCRPTLLADAGVARPRVGQLAGRRRPRRQAAAAQPGRAVDVDAARARHRHPARRLPARPGREPLRARRAARPLRRPRAARRGPAAAGGQLDLDGDVGAAPRRRRPPGARRRSAASRRSPPPLDAQGLRDLNDDDRDPAGAGAGQDGGRRRRRRRRRAARRSTTS